MDHSIVSSWKKAQVKDAHFHLYLPHSLLHDYSNPLAASSANARPLALLLATQAMTARVAFFTCSALSMISHPASTSLISNFHVNRSNPAAPSLDACKPSQNQNINIMQQDLHPPHPYYSQSFLGALTFNFYRIILNNTSSYQQNCTRYPCWAHTDFRLLGQPVGSATFASNFFACRIEDIKKNIT